MTQDNKIWHTPDEKPEDGSVIVVLGPMGYESFVWEITEHRAGRHHYENWYKWAYLVDIIISLESSSKALDVAIDALKRLRDVPDEDNDQWFNYCCPRCVLQEISEIMKGGKQ